MDVNVTEYVLTRCASRARSGVWKHTDCCTSFLDDNDDPCPGGALARNLGHPDFYEDNGIDWLIRNLPEPFNGFSPSGNPKYAEALNRGRGEELALAIESLITGNGKPSLRQQFDPAMKPTHGELEMAAYSAATTRWRRQNCADVICVDGAGDHLAHCDDDGEPCPASVLMSSAGGRAKAVDWLAAHLPGPFTGYVADVPKYALAIDVGRRAEVATAIRTLIPENVVDVVDTSILQRISMSPRELAEYAQQVLGAVKYSEDGKTALNVEKCSILSVADVKPQYTRTSAPRWNWDEFHYRITSEAPESTVLYHNRYASGLSYGRPTLKVARSCATSACLGQVKVTASESGITFEEL